MNQNFLSSTVAQPLAPWLARLSGLTVSLLVCAAPLAAAGDKDSCVVCHQNPALLVTNKQLYEYFQQWQLSVHRQEDVSCSDCHGGNPEAADKDGAHAVEFSAASASSSVNFKNIPDTCGQCHEDIYEGYQQSPHFKHLVAKDQEKQGPNCVTCHGSISSVAPNVNTVRDACSRCHNDETENHPEIPDEAKRLLNSFLSIHRYYRYVAIRGEPAESREFLESIDDRAHDLSINWHTFDLEAIGERTSAILKDLREKRKELRARRAAENPSTP